MNIKILDLSYKENRSFKNIAAQDLANFSYLKKNFSLEVLSDGIKWVSANKENKLVIIYEHSSLVFMYTSKNIAVVCAEISDPYSAMMAISHNNANIFAISPSLVTSQELTLIINNIYNSKFESGRHNVRLDMLEKQLKEKE